MYEEKISGAARHSDSKGALKQGLVSTGPGILQDVHKKYHGLGRV
jgi:hypothetical protein